MAAIRLILDAARPEHEKCGGRKLQSVPQAGRIKRIPEGGNDDSLTLCSEEKNPYSNRLSTNF
jgi:hypothetical protein